jgi:peptide-methionine (S)-S-oxide reductase
MKQNNLVAFLILSFLPLFFISCGGFLSKNHNKSEEKNDLTSNKNKEIRTMSSNEKSQGNETAVLAGGCFWCLDAVYQKLEGVTDIECGYSNGTKKNPTYEEVCSGTTKHAEVVKITYDTNKISYQELLEVFWRIHDPTTLNRQGNDIGTQYRSGIYYQNEAQKIIALASKEAVKSSGLWEGNIVTEIIPLENYYTAEDYHQDYFTNNPENQYCVYVVGAKVEKFKKDFKDKLKK